MNSSDSLARGVAAASPGTLHARSVAGDIRVPPSAGRTVRFGRGDEPDVDLCVGEDDLRVSRRHGELTYSRRQWWLRNTGQQLVRLPRGRLMHTSTEPVPLAAGYTPLFVQGSGHREHLVELYVTSHDQQPLVPRRRADTLPPKRWPLDEDERLLLVVLGQRYLRYEEAPRPLSYRQAAEQLSYLREGSGWGERRIEHRIVAVRRRLSDGGFPQPLLQDREAGGPCDNNLLHNLLKGLVESTTLVPPDLDLIDDPEELEDLDGLNV
ncbi:FHA domain-containing protein [Streptomyces armeniacus]|uniref:FHA domain-containing protein n=1 Tax=Streptomyces armeniacus TaxID=83291 RepID=A0A345XVN0_9ACTN|nr:FHA domain-containing protein [Streptomyces armeniacus]AXK35696.1 FHA domain-containing protein [Streptomyces armeniacus]